MAPPVHYNSDPLWTSDPCVCAAGTFVPLGWKQLLLLHSRTVGGGRISSRHKKPHPPKRPQFFLSSDRVWVFFPSAEEASRHNEWFVRRHFPFQPFSRFIPTLPPPPTSMRGRLMSGCVFSRSAWVCLCVRARVEWETPQQRVLNWKFASPFMKFKEPVSVAKDIFGDVPNFPRERK